MPQFFIRYSHSAISSPLNRIAICIYYITLFQQIQQYYRNLTIICVIPTQKELSIIHQFKSSISPTYAIECFELIKIIDSSLRYINNNVKSPFSHKLILLCRACLWKVSLQAHTTSRRQRICPAHDLRNHNTFP